MGQRKFLLYCRSHKCHFCDIDILLSFFLNVWIYGMSLKYDDRLKTEDKNRFGNRNKKTSFLFCIALN